MKNILFLISIVLIVAFSVLAHEAFHMATSIDFHGLYFFKKGLIAYVTAKSFYFPKYQELLACSFQMVVSLVLMFSVRNKIYQERG
jgi:hypothetical protein